MGGELYRYLRLRKRVPTEQEQLTYALLLPRFRELFERKLERANNLYLELSAVLLQVEQRENEVAR